PPGRLPRSALRRDKSASALRATARQVVFRALRQDRQVRPERSRLRLTYRSHQAAKTTVATIRLRASRFGVTGLFTWLAEPKPAFAIASAGSPSRSRACAIASARRRLERETGIEPATNSLEGCDSTTELLPPTRLAT